MSTPVSDGTQHSRCMAAATAVLGDKWNPHIIRALEGEPLRFCEIQDAAGGVNPRTLSGRLSRLEELLIVEKRILSEYPRHTDYRLTEPGRALLPILDQMAEWSERFGPA